MFRASFVGQLCQTRIRERAIAVQATHLQRRLLGIDFSTKMILSGCEARYVSQIIPQNLVRVCF